MSYGSETCPHCQGEVKVFVDGDGSASGRCYNCGKTMTFLPRKWKPRIPDEGAFYEVVVTEWIDHYQGIEYGMKSYKSETVSWEQSLAVYTNLEQARKRCAEIKAEAEAKSTETDIVNVVPYIKRWNHDRTDWEWWRPEWAEQEASA